MSKERTPLTAEALAQYKADFDKDGCFKVPGMLSEADMQKVEAVFEYGLEHPGPYAFPKPTGHKVVYIDHGLSHLWKSQPYLDLFSIPAFGQLGAALFESQDVWFIDEQLTWKRGGSKRTPWHQDTRYFNYDGPDQVQLWIALGSLKRENALEFVGGSHLGPVYGHIEDSETRLGEKPPMPVAENALVLKDIQPRRDQFDIKGWPVERGDVLAFHPRTIHGGAPDSSDLSRRSLTVRMCGPRTVRTPTPDGMEQGMGTFGFYGAVEALPLGAPIVTLEEPLKIWPAA